MEQTGTQRHNEICNNFLDKYTTHKFIQKNIDPEFSIENGKVYVEKGVEIDSEKLAKFI